ncbi:hypothetical protein HDU82_004353 [Entophlyctis luteolus]|nr:hypothetical protein HDU82_004353 [Entophlyctis luteolus]
MSFCKWSYMVVTLDLKMGPWFKSRSFTIRPNEDESEFIYSFEGKGDSDTVIGGRNTATPCQHDDATAVFLPNAEFLNPFRPANLRYSWTEKGSHHVALQKWAVENANVKDLVGQFQFNFTQGGSISCSEWGSQEEAAFLLGTALQAIMRQGAKKASKDNMMGFVIGVLTGGGGQGILTSMRDMMTLSTGF